MIIDLNREWFEFFQAVRPMFGGSLSQDQVDGMRTIVKAGQEAGLLRNQLAYVLATVKAETGSFQPIPEVGKGKGHRYGVADSETGHTYYGRGYVQLTWRGNYERAGTELGVDLVNNPDRALEPEIAVKILIRGMVDGWFTGRKLDDYINLGQSDFHNARRIVNALDRASEIAQYAQAFDAALLAAKYGVVGGEDRPTAPATTPEEPTPMKPDVTPVKPVWTQPGAYNKAWKPALIVFAILGIGTVYQAGGVTADNIEPLARQLLQIASVLGLGGGLTYAISNKEAK